MREIESDRDCPQVHPNFVELRRTERRARGASQIFEAAMFVFEEAVIKRVPPESWEEVGRQ